jgi:hypothetical protein
VGYRLERGSGRIFVAREAEWAGLKQAGLDRPAGWLQRLVKRDGEPGRGAGARLQATGGVPLRLKQLRRGGALAGLWRERFVGRRRLIENLTLPLEARRRGVATPRAVALLLVAGPPGLYRGWLGTEEIAGAVDLASRFACGNPPQRAQLRLAMLAARTMHEAGVDHPDLNLGNLLLAQADVGELRAWICDLDGARLYDGPVAFAVRQRALRRLERSYVKVVWPSEASDEVRESFYSLYAGKDRPLAARLARGRPAGRGWVRLHRLGWRR